MFRPFLDLASFSCPIPAFVRSPFYLCARSKAAVGRERAGSVVLHRLDFSRGGEPLV